MKLVWGCKEVHKENIWWFIRRKENVGNVVETNKFCNSRRVGHLDHHNDLLHGEGP